MAARDGEGKGLTAALSQYAHFFVTGTKARNADQEGEATAFGSLMGLSYEENLYSVAIGKNPVTRMTGEMFELY